jgi:starvation-inducible DNA-binding protein
MDQLIAAVRIALANTFTMYFKTHSYHWNVEDRDFSEYHEFFGDIYTDLYNAIDPLAENLRKLGAYAPISLNELYNYKTILEDSVRVITVEEMLSNLIKDNEETLQSLSKVFDLATAAKEQGLANFAADRMDQHRKHGWMLKASSKR